MILFVDPMHILFCSSPCAFIFNRQTYDLTVPALLSLYFFRVYFMCVFLNLWIFDLVAVMRPLWLNLDPLIHHTVQIYSAWAYFPLFLFTTIFYLFTPLFLLLALLFLLKFYFLLFFLNTLSFNNCNYLFIVIIFLVYF